mmetsp:Transcript_24433/g.42021  ORF Transcript_24433/g.42021 Transcript_24433/m.42021 type:complete len:318 (-) Transcript_24433:769-1722(-)
MQNDEVIWHLINHGHCSHKVKTEKSSFCRNKYNITGLCTRQACPLANSRYATILEEDGVLYLYMKTIERAHTPSKLWERVKLHQNYTKALEQVDKHLIYWPKFLVHKAKQRLTKMTQYLIRMRKLKLKPQPKLVGIHKKVEKREANREKKALKAANLEKSIEKELLERLKQGTYGDIYNFPTKEYEKVLDEAEISDEEAEASERRSESQMDSELDEDFEQETEFVEGPDLEDEDLDDFEDMTGPLDSGDEDDQEADEEEEESKKAGAKRKAAPKDDISKGKGSKKRKPGSSSKKGAYVEIEYERETEALPGNELSNW